MQVFMTSDLHFGHKNILKHCNRPYDSVEDMDEGLVANWNNKVPKKDSIVYIVGDFAFNNHNKYLSRLNGKKVLIIGSHDHMSHDVLRNFTAVYPSDGREEGTFMMKHDGRYYFMQHCCPRVWARSHYGVPCLFGHSHGRLKTWNLSFDVGVDTKLSNYSPIHISDIDKEIELRKMEMDKDGRIVRENGRLLFRQDDINYKRG